jgi:hypothetical protein
MSLQGVKQSEVLAILRWRGPKCGPHTSCWRIAVTPCKTRVAERASCRSGSKAASWWHLRLSQAGQRATSEGSGPYAAAQTTEWVKPGQTDLIMFHNVPVAVMDKTKGDQVPWTEDGIHWRQRIIFGAEGKVPSPLIERSPEHPFDGVWYVERHSSNCGNYNKLSATLAIKEGKIVSALGAGGVQGLVTTSGTLNLTHKSIAGGVQRYSGRLQGKPRKWDICA